jgi:hypothetical protein
MFSPLSNDHAWPYFRPPCDPADELDGNWPYEQLVEMNARFAAAMEQAFELGLERRESAAGQVKLPAGLGPRWSTPLCATVLDGLLRSAAGGGTVFVARD